MVERYLKINFGKIVAEEVLKGRVVVQGTGAHTHIPREHLGKECIIIVLKESLEEDKK